jgi:two-component system nitrate/nitrite response regulator NarL
MVNEQQETRGKTAAGSGPAGLSLLIADDHVLLLDAVTQKLSQEPDITLDVVTDYDSAVARLDAHGPYDVLLLDVRMPGMEGLSSIQTVVERNRPGVTAIFSGEVSPSVVRKCIETGARGYVPKSISLNSLSNIIRLLASGQVFLPADISLGRKRPGASEAARSITDREVLTLQLGAEGKTNKEIAYALDATEMTVKMIMRQVCTKLEAKNRAHATAIAKAQGFI